MQGNSYPEANSLFCSYIFYCTDSNPQITSAIWIKICALQIKRAHWANAICHGSPSWERSMAFFRYSRRLWEIEMKYECPKLVCDCMTEWNKTLLLLEFCQLVRYFSFITMWISSKDSYFPTETGWHSTLL